jgi:hypothetical protein
LESLLHALDLYYGAARGTNPAETSGAAAEVLLHNAICIVELAPITELARRLQGHACPPAGAARHLPIRPDAQRKRLILLPLRELQNEPKEALPIVCGGPKLQNEPNAWTRIRHALRAV